MTTRICIRK